MVILFAACVLSNNVIMEMVTGDCGHLCVLLLIRYRISVHLFNFFCMVAALRDLAQISCLKYSSFWCWVQQGIFEVQLLCMIKCSYKKWYEFRWLSLEWRLKWMVDLRRCSNSGDTVVQGETPIEFIKQTDVTWQILFWRRLLQSPVQKPITEKCPDPFIVKFLRFTPKERLF